MREALRGALSASDSGERWRLCHPQLAYGPWAPVRAEGKIKDEDRLGWLHSICCWQPDRDYAKWFEGHWRRGLEARGESVECFELQLAARLLVGAGNPSATDVGITLHRTWGVPLIPGSALKGLASSYVALVYADGQPEQGTEENEEDRALRRRWRPPSAGDGGDLYAQLFGLSPERGPGAAGRPEPGADRLQGGQRGSVCFHDALYVPESGSGSVFAVDVTTVHQRSYYDTGNRAESHLGQATVAWPNDWEAPTPISYLTVAPGARFLFAIAGPRELRDIARRLLEEALERWGVAAKTSAGYGRLTAAVPRERPAAPTVSAHSGARVKALLLEEKTKKGGWRARYGDREGPIVNSRDVPADLKPGDELEVTISSVDRKGLQFRFEPKPADRTAKGKRAKPSPRRR